LAYRVVNPTASAEVMERIRRMARVLVAPLRIKIMVALSARPMSPRMYQQEHGGGELSRIDDNFKALTRYGWIELVETKTGGERRGATEHIYRVKQLPILDSDVWSALPKAMQEMVSWRVFDTLATLIKEAFEAGTMDARDDRHLTSTSGLVDLLGWDRIVGRVDGLFEFFLEERKDSACRLAGSGEQPIPLVVALAAFESPERRFEPERLLVETRPQTPSIYALSLRMAKAMIDPLRITILAELGTRAMSAKGFFEEFGGGEVTRERGSTARSARSGSSTGSCWSRRKEGKDGAGERSASTGPLDPRPSMPPYGRRCRSRRRMSSAGRSLAPWSSGWERRSRRARWSLATITTLRGRGVWSTSLAGAAWSAKPTMRSSSSARRSSAPKGVWPSPGSNRSRSPSTWPSSNRQRPQSANTERSSRARG
jgi:hypothetical protein